MYIINEYLTSCNEDIKITRLRRVAQPGSALPWGGRGRKFKSSRADQKKDKLDTSLANFFGLT